MNICYIVTTILLLGGLEFLLLKDGCHTQKGQQVVLSQNKSFHLILCTGFPRGGFVVNSEGEEAQWAGRSSKEHSPLLFQRGSLRSRSAPFFPPAVTGPGLKPSKMLLPDAVHTSSLPSDFPPQEGVEDTDEQGCPLRSG